MVPEVFLHTPLSNAIIFAAVSILDTLFAFIIYRIMHAFRPAVHVKDEITGEVNGVQKYAERAFILT